jgi:hypothetical protein
MRAMNAAMSMYQTRIESYLLFPIQTSGKQFFMEHENYPVQIWLDEAKRYNERKNINAITK